MRVLSRCRLLAVGSVLASALVPMSGAAADEGVHLLAPPQSSGTPQYVEPLVQTAAGLVYRNLYDSTTWIKPPGAALAQPEDRLTGPVVVGDLLSSYDPAGTTLSWRTTADATLHETLLPPELTYLTRTATGYLARAGAGPFDLVSVDVLGSSEAVIGGTPQVEGVLAGPLGAAVPSQEVPGQWRYYPYDASATSGRPIQAPAQSDHCQLAGAHLYCWSATALTRLPLDGTAGTTIPGAPGSLVGTTGGVAFTTPDARYPDVGWHKVWVWRSGEASPVLAVDGDQRLTRQLAPVIDGTGVALATRGGDLSRAGIYRISDAFALSHLTGTKPQPLTASAIAVGPGRVVWSDNSGVLGAIRERFLVRRTDGTLSLGPDSTLAYGSDGTALSVSGSRVAYTRNGSDRGLVLTGVNGDPHLATGEAIRSALSGQRLLAQSRGPGGALRWQLTDLTEDATTTLPDAVSYDLWGERLARLDADGSVWLRDLRTSSAAVPIAPALPGGAVGGTVQVAGDMVGWAVRPAGGPAPGVLVRNVASMAPAHRVAGLSELQDLSTGYAVGTDCDEGGSCSTRAVSLADEAVTPVDTDSPVAVDANILGFITAARLPAVRTLATYADAPRLLAAPGAPADIDFDVATFTMRLWPSQVLTSCALEIRDVDDALVRSVPCTPSGYGDATAAWNGLDLSAERVSAGTYSWRIVASNGDRPLVDYDGSTAALAGTVAVEGPEEVAVPMPDLGFAHRRSDGGINLFRMPLSEVEDGVGTPRQVRALPAKEGFRTDRSKVVAGDFADWTPGDDGTADHIVWHAGSDGGIRVYAVPGSSDTTPRLLRALPKSAGWSWADSRPLAGDVNGDTWDDLLIVHRARAGSFVWVMLSNGTQLGAPQRWGAVPGDFGTSRDYVADADGDGNEDLLSTGPATSTFRTTTLLTRRDGTGALAATDPTVATFRTADGWSLAYARQLAGDVTGDGLVDLVTVHRASGGGVLVWVSASCSADTGDVCWRAPRQWANLSSGWSFASSRQYLADTDGDSVDDLISVHRSGAGGMFVWRQLSEGNRLGSPQRIADLPTSTGWNWSLSRETVADTWGMLAP